MRVRAVKAVLCCLLLFFFLAAYGTGGSRIDAPRAGGGHGKGSCIVSFDYCDHGGASLGAQALEPAATPAHLPDTYFEISSSLHPVGAGPAASADPQETEKPPEA